MRPGRLAVLVAGLALAACGTEPEPVAVERCDPLDWGVAPEGASVVLVLNDTWRRDRTGVYGGPAATPRFDGFAADAWLFERASSPAPWTKPSVASLFTGLHPSQHGILTHPGAQMVAGQELVRDLRESDVLPEAFDTLAEVFQAGGYRTAAFVANPWLDRRFGFDQGFATYEDGFARWGVGGDQVVEAGLAWLAGLPPDAPYFLYLHLIDTHRPYPSLPWEEALPRLGDAPGADLPEATRREIQAQVRIGPDPPPAAAAVEATPALLQAAYDRGIERFDAILGRFLDAYAERPERERAVVIVTSDHGESLYERGFGNHGTSLYEAEIGVPLAIDLPGRGGRRVGCPVGQAGLLPTLCDYLGLDCPDGLPVASWLAPAGPEPFIASEGVAARPAHRTIVSGAWKLVHQPDGIPGATPSVATRSLYRLDRDPGETHDLLADEPPSDAALAAERTLAGALEASVPAPPDVERETAPLDADVEERLRELGYLD